MHSNALYRAFLLAVLLITFWYTGVAIYRYYHYTQLKSRVHLTSSEWKVHEKAEDEFYLETHYAFTDGLKQYEGEASWPQEFYRNSWAAEKDIPYFKNKYAMVWYNPHNPHISSLQKRFPLKEALSAIVLWGLLVYFLWLGFYVTKFKN